MKQTRANCGWGRHWTHAGWLQISPEVHRVMLALFSAPPTAMLLRFAVENMPLWLWPLGCHPESTTGTFLLHTTTCVTICLSIHQFRDVNWLIYARDGLAEDTVWFGHLLPLLKPLPRNILDMAHHGVTEMVNNAVDHSEAMHVDVRMDLREEHLLLVLDFDGIQAIGQAFADEVFRVFANTHPQVELVAEHAVPEVQQMIRRAQIARDRGNV